MFIYSNHLYTNPYKKATLMSRFFIQFKNSNY